jgi:polyhydroxybutyrate depolymerase
MRKLVAMVVVTILMVGSIEMYAQTVDAGRGDIPLIVPTDYDNQTAIPLLVLLHGYSFTGNRQEDYMKFGELVNSHGFLLAYPDGTKESGGDRNQFWNAGETCCNFMGSDVDDSAYVLSIIQAVQSKFNIDPKKIYLVGHSNGGFMSYRAAHDHSGTIAAIASLAGAGLTIDASAPPNPVHVLQIHGTSDSVIAYEGGDIQGNTYPGAVATVKRWAGFNGCAVEGVDMGRIDLEKEIAGEETTVTRYTKGCNSGGSSELWTIEDGSHVPVISETFSQHIVEWLLAHPKS